MKLKRYGFLAAASVLATCMLSCSKTVGELPLHTSKTVILYSAGYNNLTGYFKEDIEDICNGFVPWEDSFNDHLFIFAHHTAATGDYSTPTSPYLIKVYRNRDLDIVRDTILTYPETTCSASAETFGNVLRYIHENYPSEETGVIFSSHATGWLPKGYYGSATTSIRFSAGNGADSGAGRESAVNTYDPHINFFHDGLRTQHERDMLPDVKSIGAQYVGSYTNTYEMELKDFAAAIPFRLDYIIFDACLMGGIEVAYELKDACDVLVFSSSQVLADGMDYTTIIQRLMRDGAGGPLKVAQDFYDHYNAQSGVYRSATISLIDCRKLDALAVLCKWIFEKYRSQINYVNAAIVQKLDPTPWFYDFGDIIDKLGITDEEAAELEAVLNECVPYHANTPSLLSVGEVLTFSGLSMYLPSAGNDTLDGFYKELKWNTDTQFVR